MSKKPDQYYEIGVMGKEMHDYWQSFKPQMYKEMEQNGTLWTVLQSEGMRLDDLICDLMQKGLSEDQAKEVARAQIYDEMMD